MRAALVGEFCEVDQAAMVGLWERVADRCRRVTVIAVANPYRQFDKVVLCTVAGAFVADVTFADPHAAAEAERHARVVVELAPAQVDVEHLVVMSWSHARRYVSRLGYAHVVVADRPTRARDRVYVRMSGWASRAATPLAPEVVGRPPRRDRAW